MSDTRTDTVSHQNEVPGMEEVQGDVDELIDDLIRIDIILITLIMVTRLLQQDVYLLIL